MSLQRLRPPAPPKEITATSVVPPPICTTAGYTLYTCTVCGYSYTDQIRPATGHQYTSVVTAPTCTADGFTTYTCELCEYSYTGNVVTAPGHDYTSVVTDPTCTEDGYTVHSCTVCGSSYTGEVIGALGHSYVNGLCSVCGVKDPTLPNVTTPTISLKYPTLSFEDVIVMNVYYTAADLGSVEEMGLITYSQKVSSWSVDTAEAVVPGYDFSDEDGMYFSSTAGIAPKNLGDTIYFAVYARLTDGSYTYTALAGYSPKTYAYNQLKSGSAEMRPLVVAMLNYGAAAQTYFGYKTDALVNSTLTADQLALIRPYDASMMSAVTQPDSTKLGEMVSNGGYTRRYPTISFEGAFCINYYFVPTAAPAGQITMYVWNQAAYNAAPSLSKSNATAAIAMELTDSGEYLAVVEGIAAKDLDRGIYVSFCYCDGTTDYCSGVIGYSIGTYCTAQTVKTGTLADLAAATAVYGYYAKELFYEKA